MVLRCFEGRIEAGSKLTHDDATCYKPLVSRHSLVDDCHKYDPGDEMKLMNNCCLYIRHCFDSHRGINASKAEAYANLPMYIWCHKRTKKGTKFVIEC